MKRSLSDILSDPARLEAIRRVAMADAATEEAFDRLSGLATRMLRAPVSLVTLVEEDRQVFRGCVGLPEPWASRRETPLSHSFCQHALVVREPLVIEDARKHPELRESLAIPDLGVVAYAGIPLVTSAGQPIGTFCVIDHEPRQWSETDIAILRDLAASVMTEIELRDAAYEIEREQERRLAVLEATDEGIYGMDPELRCTFINGAGARMLGYEAEEVIGRNMHRLIHSRHADGTPYPEEDCPICGTLRTGKGVRIEDDLLWRKDGTPLYVEYGAYPVLEGEEVRGAVVTFQDITSWRHAQQRSAAQHAVIRILAESPSVREARPRILEAIGHCLGWPYGAMWIPGRTRQRLRRIASWHAPSLPESPLEEVSRRLTFTRGEGLPGRVWKSGEPVWIPDVSQDDNFPRAEAAARQGLRGAFAFPVRYGEAVTGILEFFATDRMEADPALLEAMNSIGSTIGQFLERKRGEQALQQSEERYRKLVELAPDAILVHRDSEILYANPEAARLFGARDPGDLVGRSAADLVHPDFRDLARDRIRQIRTTGKPVPRIEERFLRLSGEVVHVEVSGNAITWAGRRAVQVVIRDVSGRKHAEAERMRLYEEARAAQAEAEAANRAKSQFLANVSHEIRTPVNAIVGYTDLLEMGVAGQLNDQQRKYLERIRTSSEHLTGLIDDVLDLAKAEAGRITVEHEAERVGEAVSEALALVAPQASSKRIAIHNECADRDAEYVGDADRVRQILLNLLSNAIKFTGPDGRITVSCGEVEEPEGGADLSSRGPWTWIRVEDTGIGIAPDQIERVFAPFMQAEMGHTRPHGGTGLGLTISRELAHLMGGDLTLRSTPGKGSAFTLWLPRREPGTTRLAATLSRGALPEHSLREVGLLLAGAVDTVLQGYVRRMRGDPDLPQARELGEADLMDHMSTLLSDVARSLIGAGESRLEPDVLLRDGSRIQGVIAELHGRQRARYGWTERAMEREYEILREEVERALRGGADRGSASGSEVAAELLRRAATASLQALHTAAASVQE